MLLSPWGWFFWMKLLPLKGMLGNGEVSPWNAMSPITAVVLLMPVHVIMTDLHESLHILKYVFAFCPVYLQMYLFRCWTHCHRFIDALSWISYYTRMQAGIQRAKFRCSFPRDCMHSVWGFWFRDRAHILYSEGPRVSPQHLLGKDLREQAQPFCLWSESWKRCWQSE